MSEKRRDNKNRILRTGESQRADGKYMYRYVDANGKTQCLYSWRLVKTDTVPEGKKDNGALRDIEKRVQRDVDDDIVPDGDGYTVLALVEKYISQKTGVKNTTRAGYGTVVNVLKAEAFGKKRIDKVEDVLSLGDEVTVVCLGKDKMGRISFSMKDVKQD